LAKEAIIYSNIGDIGIEDATNSIVSTLSGFELGVESVRHVLDTANAVGNKFAITTGGIGEALQRSAASMNQANNSLEETVGLYAAANKTIQNSDIVGTAFKTISMRLRAVSEESGELISGMREDILSLTQMRVDIMDGENFKSTYQILKEIAGIWDELSELEQSGLTDKIAGRYHGNVLSAAIQNFDDAIAAMETGLNSRGSAVQENERYMDSIQAKINSFKETVVGMWEVTLDTNVIKDVIDFGTAVAGVLEKILPLLNNPIIQGLLFGSILNNFGGAVKSAGSLLNGLKSGFSSFLNIIVSSVTGIKDFSSVWSLAKESGQGFLATLKAVEGQAVLTNAAVSAGTIAVSLIVSGLIAGFSHLAQSQQKAVDKANELVQTYNQESKAISDNISTVKSLEEEFTRLSKGVDDYGVTAIFAPIVRKRAMRTDLKPVNPKAA
ncbi:MAG: phage tail tape measure protein, partial [Oscillospiraceae bacterium]|nr:phage tail tape measure protein [Oscillospiraceae bacterium]